MSQLGIHERIQAKWYIEGMTKRGENFVSVPEFPHMIESLDRAKEDARSIANKYRVLRVCKEELLLAEIDEKTR